MNTWASGSVTERLRFGAASTPRGSNPDSSDRASSPTSALSTPISRTRAADARTRASRVRTRIERWPKSPNVRFVRVLSAGSTVKPPGRRHGPSLDAVGGTPRRCHGRASVRDPGGDFTRSEDNEVEWRSLASGGDPVGPTPNCYMRWNTSLGKFGTATNGGTRHPTEAAKTGEASVRPRGPPKHDIAR